MLKNCKWLVNVSFVAGMLMSVLGCGNETAARYKPSSTTARDSLQTALTTWQSGAKHGTIQTSKPAIDMFDLRWQQGTKLESFEIGDEIKGREQPAFNVKIKLDKQTEENNVYLVVGIDPLLVFRDVDYQKATGQ